MSAAVHPRETLWRRLAPIVFFELYLNASIATFAFGPWIWPIVDTRPLYTFVLSAPALDGSGAVDTITDYHAGDVVDVTEILNLSAGTDPFAEGYLRVTTDGLIQVDVDGGGDAWVTLANVNTDVDHLTFRYLMDGAAHTGDVAAQSLIIPFG